MLRNFFIFFFSFLFFHSQGRNIPALAADKIPAALLPNANAVIRSYKMETKIKSQKHAVVEVEYALTIMSEAGKKYAALEFYYSDLVAIQKADISIYDKAGKLVDKAELSDCCTRPATIGAGHYDDNRVKEFNAYRREYPYTIVVSYKMGYSQTFFLPDFRPQPNEDCALESASLVLKSVHDVPVKYKMINVETPPEHTALGNYDSYRWELTDRKAFLEEPLCRPGDGKLPVIYMAAQVFQLGQYQGSAATWRDYGRFSYDLSKGKDILPPEVDQKVQALIAGITDRRQKIDILYKYLQTNTRYVAMEYGIGGFQTADAAFVAKNQYGDCKALTNYMKALLRAAGISSNEVLIHSGADDQQPLLADFPSHQFNHVILCIPAPQDTVWLECTSTDMPANYLGDFTQNRSALLLTENGGYLVHTPIYDTNDNRIEHIITASLDENEMKLVAHNRYSGSPAYYLFHHTDKQSNHELDKYVNSKFSPASYRVRKYQYSRQDHSDRIAMKEDMDIILYNMVRLVGEYRMVNIDLVPLDVPDILGGLERTVDFYIPESFMIVDSFEIVLNENMVCEHLPQTVSYTKPFGAYFCNVTLAGNKLLVFRRFALHHGSFKPELFKDYMAWLDDVRRDATKKIMTKTKG